MDDLGVDLLALDFAERGADRFERALHVGLDDEVELLFLALLECVEKAFERGALWCGQLAEPLALHALRAEFLRGALAFEDHELIAGKGQAGEAEHAAGRGRTGFLDRLAVVVDQGFHFAEKLAADEGHADFERAGFYDDRGGRAAALLDLRLDD